jgi:hypothetical protein
MFTDDRCGALTPIHVHKKDCHHFTVNRSTSGKVKTDMRMETAINTWY